MPFSPSPPPEAPPAGAGLLAEAARREAAGDLAGAVDCLSAQLADHPADAPALLGLARLSRRLGAAADGLALLDALAENSAAKALERGHCHRALNQPRAAEAAYEQAAALTPASPEPLFALASLCEAQGKSGAARTLFDRLLQRFPDDAQTLLRASFFLRRQEDDGAAEAVCRRLVAAHPRLALAWNSLGITLYRQERIPAAEAALTTALDLDPICAPAHFSLGFLRLSQGRWEAGWEDFRWRHRLPGAPPPPAGWQAWNPAAPPPPGSQILLWNDQGLGDALQFLRYVAPLVERGYRPLLRLPPSLLALAPSVPGVETISSTHDPLPAPRLPTAAALALCDLPLALARPAPWWPGPYLRPPERSPSPPLAAGGRRGVGLVWAGSGGRRGDSGQDPATAARDGNAQRDLSLNALAPLLESPGIDWFSLQVGATAQGQIARSPWAGRLTDLGGGIGDFADTAGLMRRLDRIITVDTAAAHLAGGLGCPTALLLPHQADWRWRLAGTRSDWYPSLTLFRQPHRGDWPAVVAAVAEWLRT